MEFTEKQVFEALGVEPEDPAGGVNEQGAAAPAPEGDRPGSDQGEKAHPQGARPIREEAQPPTAGQREAAAPAADEGIPADQGRDVGLGPEPDIKGEPGPKGEPDGQEPETEKQPMTERERRDAAAKRRRQEQQAAIDEAVNKALQAEREKAKGELEGFFQAAQLKNTFTGKPITSMEEFREWRQAYDAAQLQRELKAGKLTPEALGKAISETPEMRKIQEIVDRDEQARREQGEAAARQKLAAELEEIRKMDPAVQSLEDILQMPTAKEFYTYVTKNHLSYLDAFRLANGHRLEQRTAEAARTSAMGLARSKDHMTPTRPQGSGAATVPADEARLFRLMNPEATEAEIQNYFNKNKKQ